jgi:hypothetical protein
MAMDAPARIRGDAADERMSGIETKAAPKLEHGKRQAPYIWGVKMRGVGVGQ